MVDGACGGYGRGCSSELLFFFLLLVVLFCSPICSGFGGYGC